MPVCITHGVSYRQARGCRRCRQEEADEARRVRRSPNRTRTTLEPGVYRGFWVCRNHHRNGYGIVFCLQCHEEGPFEAYTDIGTLVPGTVISSGLALRMTDFAMGTATHWNPSTVPNGPQEYAYTEYAYTYNDLSFPEGWEDQGDMHVSPAPPEEERGKWEAVPPPPPKEIKPIKPRRLRNGGFGMQRR